MKNNVLNDSQVLTLKCGRQLGFAEYGNPNGKAIFFFHGMSGSRLDARHLHGVALLNSYRLISIDRPGIGLSSPEKNRSILSWADDIQEFTDLLNIKNFSIISHSGGAPFAAACAYKIPDRLNGVAIVSGIAPFEILEATASLSGSQRFLNKLINFMPCVATLMMKITYIMFKNPRMLKSGMKQMPEVDQLALRSQGSDEDLSRALMETFRHGVTGASQEFQLIIKPWGFDISQIKLECPVTIWHGCLDRQAPLMHAKLYAKLILNTQLNFFANEGHISLLINKGAEILRSIS